MSKGTIGTFLGAGIGFLIGGPAGAQIGALIGGAVGSSFDTIPGRKVGEMSSPRAQEGEPIPLVFGSARVTGRLMSVGEPDIRTESEGGKGGPKVENETAYLSYSILVCESSELRDSSIGGILMVIENNKIVYDVRPVPAISGADSAKWKANKVFYFGGEGQGVDPTEQMIHGAGNVPAYRGLCRMVVTDEDVTQHGGSIPTYEFVTSQCGVADAELQYERVEWDMTTQTDPDAGDGVSVAVGDASYLLGYEGADNSPGGGVTADTFVSGGDWYWETTTGWLIHPGSGINHSGSSGIIRQSDDAFAGVLRQLVGGETDAGATGTLLPAPITLAPSWIPTAYDDPRYQIVRNRLTFDGGMATWQVALDGGAWVNIVTEAGTFAPFAVSRGTMADGTVTEKRVFIYSVPDDFTYAVPDGAIALGAAKAGYAGHTGTELPDSPGYYIDPDTGEITGPIATVDDCPPVTLQEIIDKLDARAGIPTANSITDELADIDVPGYAIDTFMTVAEAKEPLRQVWFFDCPEWDDAIRYRLRGQATDFTIDPDDLIEGEDATESGTRGQTVEYPKRLHVQYVDPVTGYKPMKQTAERISPDIRVKGELVAGANITLEADTAKQAADIGLKTAWTEREDSREFAIPVDYWPQAIAAHTFTLDSRRYRITELRLEAGAVYIKSVYDRISAYGSNAVGTVGPAPTAPPSNIIGPTDFAVMNLPVLRDADDSPGLYYAARGYTEGWRGAQLQMVRNFLWNTVANISTPCIMGELLAELPAADRDVIDTTNTISVRMSGTLDSVTFDDLLNEANVLAVLYPDYTAEILQFQTATEVSPGVYDLTTLIRGRLDTVIDTHDAGAQVVLLNSSIRFFELNTTELDQPTLQFRNVANGLAESTATTLTLTNTELESVREWPVSMIESERDGSDNLIVSWIGRARLGTDAMPVHSRFFTGYLVTITDGTTTRSWNTTLQSFVVSSADQTSIFGSDTFTPTITVTPTSTVTGGEVGDGAAFPAGLTGWTSDEAGWSEVAGEAVYDPTVSGVAQSMLRYETPLAFPYSDPPATFYAACDTEGGGGSAGAAGYAYYSGATYIGLSGAGTLHHPHSTVSATPNARADGIAPAVYAITNGTTPVSFSNLAYSVSE